MDVSVDPRSEYRAAQKRLEKLAGQLDDADPGSSAQLATYNEMMQAVKELAQLRRELPGKERERAVAHHTPRTRLIAGAGVLAGLGVILAIVFGLTSAAMLVLLVPLLAASALLVFWPVSLSKLTPEDHRTVAVFTLVATIGCLAVALLTAWLLILAIPSTVVATMSFASLLGLISFPETTQGADRA